MDSERSNAPEEGISSSSLRELSLLSSLRHPNIVSLKDFVQKANGEVFMVLEYIEQDLHTFITHSPDPLTNAQVKSFMRQLCAGVDFFHARGVIHRDLKPKNLLVSSQGILKIADFGIGRQISIATNEKLTPAMVTLWYRSPEVLLGSECYGRAADMWSVGCTFAEMVSKKVLFPGRSEVEQLLLIFCQLGTPTLETWPELADLPSWNSEFPMWPELSLGNRVQGLNPDSTHLLRRMLEYNPAHRISAKRAMSDIYLQLPDF